MEKKKIFLSHPIDELTPTYGKRDTFTSEEISSISQGESANSSKWIFSSNHLGTHIDVPKHFFNDGADVVSFPAEFWTFTNAQVIDVQCSEATMIYREIIDHQLSADIELLMIRTGYEQHRHSDKYWNDNPGISPEVADYLRRKYKKLRAVGFDFISLTSWKFREIGKEAHKQFLKNDPPILVIEDMALHSLQGSITEVIVLPLRVRSSNGSPVTVIAQVEV